MPLHTYPSLSTVQQMHPKPIKICELWRVISAFGDLFQLCYTTFSLFSYHHTAVTLLLKLL